MIKLNIRWKPILFFGGLSNWLAPCVIDIDKGRTTKLLTKDATMAPCVIGILISILFWLS